MLIIHNNNDKRLSILLKYQAESVDAEVSEYRGETIEIVSIVLNIVSVSIHNAGLSISPFSCESRFSLSLPPSSSLSVLDSSDCSYQLIIFHPDND